MTRNEEIARIKSKYYHNEEGSPKAYKSERDPDNENQEDGYDENLMENSPQRKGS